jgi:hypothetical protein
MPRRGSRAQLIHLLAKVRAWQLAEVYGYHHHAAELYEDFAQCSLAELREWASGLEPDRRGRPKSWRSQSRYQPLLAEVDVVLARNVGMSVRSACAIVARKARVSSEMLRKLYRARR